MIDIDSLTLGEVAKVESLSGLSIGQIGETDQPKGLALAALVFVAKRREDPAYTWNQAQDVTVVEANEILGKAAADADETADVAGEPGAGPFPPQLADES